MYQVRIYTLRSPKAAEEYCEVCWKKHVESLEDFGIHVERVFKQVKSHGWTHVIALCRYDEGVDIEAVNKAYTQSDGFKEDMHGFGFYKMRHVQDITVVDADFMSDYGFCSEAMLEQRTAEVAEQAAYEERLAMGIERGRADYAAGRVVRGVDAARAELKKR